MAIQDAHSSSTGFEVLCVASLSLPIRIHVQYLFLLLTHKNSRPRMPPLFLTTCDFNNPTYVPRWLSMILGMLYVSPQLVATEVQLGLGMRMIAQSKHAALITLLRTIYGVQRR